MVQQRLQVLVTPSTVLPLTWKYDSSGHICSEPLSFLVYSWADNFTSTTVHPSFSLSFMGNPSIDLSTESKAAQIPNDTSSARKG